MNNDSPMDIESFIHKTPADFDPKPGHLLLADPMLPDPNFCRTAVLILDREEDGDHLGLVMNRAIKMSADAILNDWPGSEKMPIFIGGPVELDRLFMLHRLGDIVDDSVELFPGVYTGGNADQLRDYVASGAETEGFIRFFLGYAGWGAGQLTSEIIAHSWGVNTAPDVKTILCGDGTEYWNREVASLGPEFRSWLNIPQHPSLN